MNHSATLNIEQYTIKDLYDVFDMSTTENYNRDYVTKKYNPSDEHRVDVGHFGEEWKVENK